MSAIPRFRQTGLHGSELCWQCFQGTLCYERIHCFLDNDRAGMEALQQIKKEYNNTRHIRNVSHIYGGCKDLNEYLQKQAAAKKQAQSIKVKTPPNKPGGFRL